MEPKYSNIFWHEGVRVLSEKELQTPKGSVRIKHLENDVTKALINVFEHTSGAALKAFLKMIGIRDAPNTFRYDCQITEENKFSSLDHRLMLSIIASDCPRISNPSYNPKTSRPDAAIRPSNTGGE